MNNPTAGDRESIFITGAAGGMGRATAVLFARKGWFIGAADINEEGLNVLQVEIKPENCIKERRAGHGSDFLRVAHGLGLILK